MSAQAGIRYVTLAYGPAEPVYRQASMLLLSLLAHAPAPRELVVVTERPDRFEWFEGSVAIHTVTPEQIARWQAPGPFSMRAKLEVLRATAPRDDAVVLLDADTIAVASLAPLAAELAGGALYMHKREFQLAASRRRGNRALWRALRGRRFAGWQFEADDAMWNSGVLGVAAADRPLVDEALRVYDAMAQGGIRHFATEQLAVGLVFGRTGRLREAAPWFTHYWGNKQQFDAAIARRLAQARNAGEGPAVAAERLRCEPLHLPAEVRLRRLEKLRRWLRPAAPV